MTDLALVAACEERIVSCWPALRTLIAGDWVIRMANGYSGRANSASALRAGARLDDYDLDRLIGLYRATGARAAIRLTPLADPALAGLLETRGWTCDDRSIGMLGALEAGRFVADPAVTLSEAPTAGWVAGVCALQSPDKQDAATFGAMMALLTVPARFATLVLDDRPVAFGMAAADRGMMEIGSIIVDPAWRGRGFGRRLVESLLACGPALGAGSVFLQVDGANATARGLYRSLGLRDLYPYGRYEAPDDRGPGVRVATTAPATMSRQASASPRPGCA